MHSFINPSIHIFIYACIYSLIHFSIQLDAASNQKEGRGVDLPQQQPESHRHGSGQIQVNTS